MNSRDDRHDGEDTHAENTTDTKGVGHAEENRENEMRRTKMEMKSNNKKKQKWKSCDEGALMEERALSLRVRICMCLYIRFVGVCTLRNACACVSKRGKKKEAKKKRDKEMRGGGNSIR